MSSEYIVLFIGWIIPFLICSIYVRLIFANKEYLRLNQKDFECWLGYQHCCIIKTIVIWMILPGSNFLFAACIFGSLVKIKWENKFLDLIKTDFEKIDNYLSFN